VAGLLQQIAARKPEVASAISEVVGQVQAIAQVYGLQVGAGGPLRLKNVIEAIANSVQRTFGRPITVTFAGEHENDWLLPEAESIPIALSLNEDRFGRRILRAQGIEKAIDTRQTGQCVVQPQRAQLVRAGQSAGHFQAVFEGMQRDQRASVFVHLGGLS